MNNKLSEAPIFSSADYPKSYVSIKPGDFRLKEFSELTSRQLQDLSDQLYVFCEKRADEVPPLASYEDLPYIASGWEWSVFRKDQKTVLKVPAGIFAEVKDPKYLENSRLAYEVLQTYYPAEFIAKTQFYRSDDTNKIEQEFIENDNIDLIPFSCDDKELLHNFERLLTQSQKMLNEYQWMPDFWFAKTEAGFEINNVVIQKETNLLKIIDFTFYFDPYRIYSEKMDQAIAEHSARIEEFLAWIKAK